MKKKELYTILTELSDGYLSDKIDGNLFARICEGLIATNLDIVPELEELADKCAQYHEPQDSANLISKKELTEILKVHFKDLHIE
jgi:hypothetical protein